MRNSLRKIGILSALRAGEYGRFLLSHQFLVALLICAVVVLSMNGISDMDAWLHLSLGRLIWEEGVMPDAEAYLIPAVNRPFTYTSWLFGCAVYKIYLLSGATGLVLFKALMAGLFIYLIYIACRRAYGFPFISILLALGSFLLLYPRLVLRPEIVVFPTMVLVIYLLNSYLYDGSKGFLTLPLLTLLWANVHSSIILIPVIFGAFIIGGLIQNFLNSKHGIRGPALSRKRLWPLLAVCALSVLTTFLNPNGLRQYTFPLEVLMATDWYNINIIELQPPIAVEIVAIAIIVTYLTASFLLNIRRLSIANVFLVIPLIYASFTARRFLNYLTIAAVPVIALNLAEILSHLRPDSQRRSRQFTYAACLIIVALLMLNFLSASPNALQHSIRPSLAFDYSNVPKKAVEYLREKGIKGNILNPFEYGQYIVWELYPSVKVFIDGRGNLSPGDLYRYSIAPYSKKELDALDAEMGFDALMLKYSSLEVEGVEIRNPRWALVYWDDMVMVYLKKAGTYKEIARAEEYALVRPDDSLLRFIEAMRMSWTREEVQVVVTELQRNARQTNSSRARLMLAVAYALMGQHGEAVDHFQSVLDYRNQEEMYQTSIIMGQSYLALEKIDDAVKSFYRALEVHDDTAVRINIAERYLQRNMAAEAVDILRGLPQKQGVNPRAELLLNEARRQMHSK